MARLTARYSLSAKPPAPMATWLCCLALCLVATHMPIASAGRLRTLKASGSGGGKPASGPTPTPAPATASGSGSGGGGGGGNNNPVAAARLDPAGRPIPVTPFGAPNKICPADGRVVLVQGYPSSPVAWLPFQLPFALPPRAVKDATYTRPVDGHQIDAYRINVAPVAVNLTCHTPTVFIAYNGTVPGPTFRVFKGNEALVRITNNIPIPTPGMPNMTTIEPCNETVNELGQPRFGRALTTHHHGSASLAPFDGWAEDETCGGEAKDYVYPSNRDATEWYHDHALDFTTDNVYYGLAGFYTINEPCGSPWNLDALPDFEMVFQDKVLNERCELYYDFDGPHDNNLYGDLNLVNGIPWPVLDVDPKWYHFRWLGGGPSRPWLLQIVRYNTATGVYSQISGTSCRVIGGDGGYRSSVPPVSFEFPADGLPVGVAERYQVACDFSPYAGETLYLFNAQVGPAQKDVPFFCYSHLLMKINVAPCAPNLLVNGVCTVPLAQQLRLDLPPPVPVIDDVITPEIKAIATAMAAKGQWTRQFQFGRGNGHWVINNQDWFTQRVAAGDVGQNTWELWQLVSGGGWFHPVHIHLVDFYIVARDNDPNKVRVHERNTPKDVVFLGPGGSVTLLIRFGPHQGEYMFHCHNLDHEDHVMMRSFNVTPDDVGLRPQTVAPVFDPVVVNSNNFIYDIYADPRAAPVAPRPAQLFTPTTNTTYLQEQMDTGYYRIFYPTGQPPENPLLTDFTRNPWVVTNVCRPPLVNLGV